MNTKLQKLAKRLNTFNLDDLAIMLDQDSQITQEQLSDLVESREIKKLSDDSYIYCGQKVGFQSNNKKLKPKKYLNRIIFTDEQIQKFIEGRKTSERYLNAPPFLQKIADKYILLLKEVNGLTGNKIDHYIKNVWNKNNPDMKASKTCYIRARKVLKDFGIEGLIPVNRNFSVQNSSLNEDLYQEFKDYVLSNRGKSLKYNYNRFKEEYLAKNTEAEDWEFPSYNVITYRIKKDIIYFNDKTLGEFYTPSKKVKFKKEKKYGFKGFKAAATDFIRYLKEERQIKASTLKTYTGYIDTHLIPFFQEYRFEDITDELIEKYKVSQLEVQLSPSNINNQISILSKIINMYAPDEYIPRVKKLVDSENFYSEMIILSEDEIKKLLTTAEKHFSDFYSLIFTALLTGATRGEVLALSWDKVDFEKKRIFINSSLYKGEIIRHRAHNATRYIDIPDNLVNILKSWRKICPKSEYDFIFPNSEGKAQDPDNMIKRKFNPLLEKAKIRKIKFIDLRDTYASLLIKQNLPLTYIQKQLGHSSVDVTVKRYKTLIDKQQIKSINILDGVI